MLYKTRILGETQNTRPSSLNKKSSSKHQTSSYLQPIWILIEIHCRNY